MNEYKIIREVGKGGMGAVYEAYDSNGDRVALKKMSAEAASHPDYRDMFDHEVKALRKLSNPSVVKIVGEPFSDAGGNLFLPMEFVEGKTLSQIVQSDGPFDEQKALAVFLKLLDAFSYIHSKNCIHRDVKPSNIMIRPDGSVCVIDFGIAKDSKTSTGKTIGRVVGTDGYMSPEQANGLNIDTRTDIYSLGCLLHYMLTGSHAIPKQSNDYETICAILGNQFPLVSDKGITVSDKVQKAILKAVNKNMTLRFQTAEEFKKAFQSGQLDTNRYVVTVGRTGCDINYSGEYISKNHLDIVFVMNTGSNHVTITDHSRNGTGVNGRMIKGTSYDFSYFPTIKSDKSSFPTVMLSGLPDYTLDWQEVKNVLFEKMGRPTSVLNSDNTNDAITTPSPNPQPVADDITVGYGILCFVVPIAGWVLGAIWKSKYPAKAKSANKLAWYGFLFNIAISFLSNLISTVIR